MATNKSLYSSIKTIDHLSTIINKITKSNNVRIHRTKCSLLLKNVVAPSMLQELLEKIGDQPYSLIVDESTDVSITKYLCVCIRFYSRKVNNVIVKFLGLVEVEKATAEALYSIFISIALEFGKISAHSKWA